MLYRKIGDYIEKYLQSGSNKVLIVDGARQIGKSYIIRYVGQKLFQNYIEVNMEADKLGDRIFAEAKTVNDFYLALSVVAGDRMKGKENTLVFIDEIQAYDHLLTLLKFLKEDNRFTYIASGSLLGVMLKTTSSIPLGSIEIKHMYPMDFEEFLIANGIGEFVMQTMRMHFEKRQSLPDALHAKILDLFKKYLIVGGLPDAVNTFVEQRNVMAIRKIQEDIHALYALDASKYEKEHARLKIQRIYNLIPSNLENRKKRIIAKSIEKKKGKRMTDYEDEFDYLISAGVALEVRAISVPSYPLMENCGKNLLKLYLNDVGLLTGLYETVVAQELRAHGFNLYYYDNKNNGEVDYLIDDADQLTVLPLEIKSGKDYAIHSALNKLLKIKEYSIHQGFVLSNEQKVYQENGITYLPIYDIMFFEPGTKVVGEL